MNKKFYYLIVAFLATATVFAQAPEKMSYQAVVRAADNTLVTNQQVGMRISILETTAEGNAVYVETHIPTTNANSLVTIEIGTGTVVSGDFSAVVWATNSFFTKTQIDPTGGTSYTITGTSELLSVPYALYAKTLGSGVTDLNALSDVLLENNSMYIGTKPATALDAPKWNLAIGNGALRLNTSGSRNTAVGYYTLSTNTLGIENTAIGGSALFNNDDGEKNTASGNYALYENTSGSSNTASGAGGLRDNTSGIGNTASGHYALKENTTGNYNTAIGYNANVNARDLTNVTAIGANAVVNASNTIQLGSTNVTAVITSGAIIAFDFKMINNNNEEVTFSDQTSAITANTTKVTTLIATIAALEARIATLEPSLAATSIGDLRAGGVVFWLDPNDNTKGLVCALQNSRTGIRWHNNSYVTTAATVTAIGAGAANTTTIINVQGGTPTNYAAGLARAYAGGGYTDWFLPSKDELNQMYKNIEILEAAEGFISFSLTYYWSSKEYDNVDAWRQSFLNGWQNGSSKDNTYYVRAVRAF
jgi:hypothetical protein